VPRFIKVNSQGRWFNATATSGSRTSRSRKPLNTCVNFGAQPPLEHPRACSSLLFTALSKNKRLVAPTFQRLLEATKESFIQAILDLQVPKMVFGRVILTGDAAFVPRPHTAGSIAKADANAHVLAELLSGEGADIDAALNRWEKSQLNSGRNMVQREIAAGDRIMNIQLETKVAA
jgi:2-polyprenyl-6-methoxyphenol hydroxylase-like FAD-dependent oxidoreductase